MEDAPVLDYTICFICDPISDCLYRFTHGQSLHKKDIYLIQHVPKYHIFK